MTWHHSRILFCGSRVVLAMYVRRACTLYVIRLVSVLLCSRLHAYCRAQYPPFRSALFAMKHRLRITSSVSPARDASLSPSPSPRRALHIKSSVSPERQPVEMLQCEELREKVVLICKISAQSRHYKKIIVRCRGSLANIRRFVNPLKQDNCKVFGLWRGTLVPKQL